MQKALIRYITLSIISLGILCASELRAQIPSLSYTIESPACIDENLNINNTTTDADSVFWDFCQGDLVATPLINESESFTTTSITGMDVVFDNDQWFGYAVSFSGNRLFRMEFGSSLQNIPTITDLGNLGGLFNGSYSVGVVQEGGVWYAIIANLNNSSLIRVRIGSDLGSDPESTSTISLTSGSLSNPRGLDIVHDNGTTYVFVGNNTGNSSTLVRFPTGIENDGEGFNISSGFSQLGVRLIKDIDNWYGYIFSSKLEKVTFGSDIWNPTASAIDVTLDNPITSGSNFEIFHDNGSYNMIAASRDGNLYSVVLGSDLTGSSGSVTDLGQFGFTDIIGFSGGRELSRYWFYGVNLNSRDLFQFEFPESCNMDQFVSNAEIPKGVNYNTSGTYNVTLYGTNNTSGITSSHTQQVTISSSTAPQISFTSSSCITNPITFTSTSDQTINTYSWDFGDGSGTSTDPNPSYTYASTGTYIVRLSVESQNGCGQFIEEEITIYNEPVAGLTLPVGTLCSNDPLTFTNTSTFDVGSPVQWNWEFGDNTGSGDFEPEHTYLEGGNYMVTLTATLPDGCVSIATDNIFIEQGATVDFDFSNSCEGEIIQFTDQSTSPSSITAWNWDFGDGGGASVQNPVYQFTSVGEFDVTLSVTNSVGCTISFTQQVNNYANPIVDFTNDLACSGGITQFTDLSVVQDANISSWIWDFGTGNPADMDTIANPTFEYQDPGDYNVFLTVRSNFGCETTFSRLVSVNPGPKAGFSWDQSCLGTETQFVNETITDPSNPLTNTIWTIESNIIQTENPLYEFNEVGSYPVILTVSAENLCESVKIDTVNVTNNPLANFAFIQSCDEDTVVFYDTTIIPPGDSVVSRFWDFDIYGTSTDSVVSVFWPDNESRTVEFQLRTENGCTSSESDGFSRDILPVASFTPDVDYGAFPLDVTLFNNSENADEYEWIVADTVYSRSEETVITFLETDTATVFLRVIANQCTDLDSAIIEIVDPEMEVQLVNVLSRTSQDEVEIILNITNNGSLVVDSENLNIISRFGTMFEFSQPFDDVIQPLQNQNYSLNYRLAPADLQRIQSICVELVTTDPENSDIMADNNEGCTFVEQVPIFNEPYPNPSGDFIEVEVVVPDPEEEIKEFRIILVNNQGSTVYTQPVQNVQLGVNRITMDVSIYLAGNYVLRVIYGDWEKSYNVVIQ